MLDPSLFLLPMARERYIIYTLHFRRSGGRVGNGYSCLLVTVRLILRTRPAHEVLNNRLNVSAGWRFSNFDFLGSFKYATATRGIACVSH